MMRCKVTLTAGCGNFKNGPKVH